MIITILKKEDDYLLVKLNLSEANLNNAEIFKEQAIALIDRNRKSLIIDLQQVEYIDSSFLGALVAVLKHAMSFKEDVILIKLRKDIYNLMELIRLDKVFKIYTYLPDAIQAIG